MALPPNGECPRYTADEVEARVTALTWSDQEQTACRDDRLLVLDCLDSADCSTVMLGLGQACPQEVMAYVESCGALVDALNPEP